MCMILSKEAREQIKAQREAALRQETESILRDTAFVLEMTRRVKEQLLADRAVRENPGE